MTRDRHGLNSLPGCLLLAAFLATAPAVCARDWYAGPKGTPKGKGTRAAPWDIASALQRKAVRPGDTLYLLAGTYRRRPDEMYVVTLAGTKDEPIHLRPAPGERAVIDGGLRVEKESAYLWVWDLEILVSEPQPAKPVGPGSYPAGFTRPWGGLTTSTDVTRGPPGCKFIHLTIHDCRQGISLWASARENEVYGCVIYDNGWPAVDRGHGHAIYTQNKDGVKTIADCIMTGGHGYTLHAYGSKRAYVDNFLVEGNIAYRAGTFLVGGDRPSRHIRVRNNYLYGVDMQVGYGAPYNDDCEVTGNTVVNGALTIKRYKHKVEKDNLVLAKGKPQPREPRVILRPSKYEPSRAHLAIYNGAKKANVPVDPGAFLKPGDSYRLMDPRHLYGKPVAADTYEGKPLPVPVKGEFAAFVVFKKAK